MLAEWIYMGDVDAHKETVSEADFDEFVEFYILADCYHFLAVRREIVSRLVDAYLLPTIKSIQCAFGSLPEPDPLRVWMVETYIQHYGAGSTNRINGKFDGNARDWVSVQPEFLAAVMVGKAKLDTRYKDVRTKTCPIASCSCCATPPCNFHAHESDLEREASKCCLSLSITAHKSDDP